MTIAQNASASAATFTVTLNNGANKTATITATIVVNGVTYTVNCAVSYLSPYEIVILYVTDL